MCLTCMSNDRSLIFCSVFVAFDLYVRLTCLYHESDAAIHYFGHEVC